MRPQRRHRDVGQLKGEQLDLVAAALAQLAGVGPVIWDLMCPTSSKVRCLRSLVRVSPNASSSTTTELVNVFTSIPPLVMLSSPELGSGEEGADSKEVSGLSSSKLDIFIAKVSSKSIFLLVFFNLVDYLPKTVLLFSSGIFLP